MIADPARVETLIRFVEAKANRRGWDETPHTLLAMRPTAGPDSPYRPIPVPLDWSGVPKGHGMLGIGLVQMAADLLLGDKASPQGRRLLADLRRHRFAGLMFLSEAWVRGMGSAEAVAAYQDGKTTSLADMPDDGVNKTVELRQIMAVDTSGTCHWLVRLRGHDPEYGALAWNESDSVTGNVTSALRLMTIAVCDGLAPGEHDIGPLAAYRDAILARPHDFVMDAGANGEQADQGRAPQPAGARPTDVMLMRWVSAL